MAQAINVSPLITNDTIIMRNLLRGPTVVHAR